MSESKGVRLWLKPERRDRRGKLVERAAWVIRDGRIKRATGCGESELAAAQEKLAEYTLEKRAKKAAAPQGKRDRSQVKVATVIAFYSERKVAKLARPEEASKRLERVLDFMGEETLDRLNEALYEDYVKSRGSESAARRELEDLRTALNYHFRAGECTAPTPVILPQKSEPRERWLTRREAARMLWTAWRQRQKQFGKTTKRRTAQHIARFLLVGLYTGSRAGAICGAATEEAVGRGWIDYEHGLFYRKPKGKRRTKKRQPPIRIPPRLFAHMRRWKRLRISAHSVVEYNGNAVVRINKGWRGVRKAAGLGDDVIPHALRHTAITWAALRGNDPYRICKFFGITMEVFEETYAHFHPEHGLDTGQRATGTEGHPDRYPDRPGVTKREQTRVNVVKLH